MLRILIIGTRMSGACERHVPVKTTDKTRVHLLSILYS